MSLLEVGGGVIEVLSTGGDPHLGGDDWDAEIVRWIMDKHLRPAGVDCQVLWVLRRADAATPCRLLPAHTHTHTTPLGHACTCRHRHFPHTHTAMHAPAAATAPAAAAAAAAAGSQGAR